MAIGSFADKGTENIFNGIDSKRARKTIDTSLWPVAFRHLDFLNRARDLRDLRGPGYGLEALRGDRTGQHSIRINRQYRICFTWTGTDAEGVEIVDYH